MKYKIKPTIKFLCNEEIELLSSDREASFIYYQGEVYEFEINEKGNLVDIYNTLIIAKKYNKHFDRVINEFERKQNNG